MVIFRAGLLILIMGAVCAESAYMVYNTSNRIVPGKLNVHLVPHTHDDVGWKKTVDQYFVGSKNSIQVACVEDILDSLIPELVADKNRKFIYVEIAFFQRWWRKQSEALQNTVKKLVSSGQLEFINGGMCMHDEATTHYIDLIDQTTLGHRWLKDVFNVTPRTGWQIDPFGHSAAQAYLLGAEVGFDSLFFARIDYQDRIKRKNEKTLEMVWQGSKTLGSSAQIFTGVFPTNLYDPPAGFNYEVNDVDPIVQDDIDLFDYNVPERVNDFVAAALSQARLYRTNHIMWTMGMDFRFTYARSWFRNMDKLIHYVNKDGRVNALYSTPTVYADAKHAADESWPLKKDDFFPYADFINAYWTGYFTSRPALKVYVRKMSAYYLAARQLEFFKGRNKVGLTTDNFADAMAIAQHHDAISGTSQQHVASDYAKRLYIGYKKAEEIVAASLACMVESKIEDGCASTVTGFQQCPLLNISHCPPTEVDLSLGKKLVVVVYNSLGWKKKDIVRIPVISKDVMVQDSSGQEIESQLLPISDVSISVRNFYATAYAGKKVPDATALFWLAFTASVPPLGFNTYIISHTKHADTAATMVTQIDNFTGNVSGTVKVGKGNLQLIYSGYEGKLIQYVNRRSSVQATVKQSYSYYTSSDGTGDNKASGAYIFRPNITVPIQPVGQVPLQIFRGPLYDEVHQKINSWIYQITRVFKEKEHAEMEFTIGPIPIDDGIGKEIATQITTTVKSNKTFYADSNGRDFLERIRDYRSDWDLEVNQPIAGNYYPINLGIYIKDQNSELSVLVDRSVGGSSIDDGQIELMLHRRLLHDDDRGVEEALNETVCILDHCAGLTVQGKYYVKIDPLGEGAKWRRSIGQEIYSPFLLAFTEQEENNSEYFRVTNFSGIDPSYNLPPNIAMITIEELANGKLLLRLAHLYEVGEDENLSVMSKVELKKLFPNIKIIRITEMSLSANQEKKAMERKRLVWKVEGSNDQTKVLRGGPVDSSELVVELAPMEIRTFILDFSRQKNVSCQLHLGPSSHTFHEAR